MDLRVHGSEPAARKQVLGQSPERPTAHDPQTRRPGTAGRMAQHQPQGQRRGQPQGQRQAQAVVDHEVSPVGERAVFQGEHRHVGVSVASGLAVLHVQGLLRSTPACHALRRPHAGRAEGSWATELSARCPTAWQLESITTFVATVDCRVCALGDRRPQSPGHVVGAREQEVPLAHERSALRRPPPHAGRAGRRAVYDDRPTGHALPQARRADAALQLPHQPHKARWIDQTAQRTWFLFEATRNAGDAGGMTLATDTGHLKT